MERHQVSPFNNLWEGLKRISNGLLKYVDCWHNHAEFAYNIFSSVHTDVVQLGKVVLTSRRSRAYFSMLVSLNHHQQQQPTLRGKGRPVSDLQFRGPAEAEEAEGRKRLLVRRVSEVGMMESDRWAEQFGRIVRILESGYFWFLVGRRHSAAGWMDGRREKERKEAVVFAARWFGIHEQTVDRSYMYNRINI